MAPAHDGPADGLATLSTYSASVAQLAAFLATRGMPTSSPDIRREHVEAFISELLERWKPATARNRSRALASFFRWLVEEGEIPASPMARMKPPPLPGAAAGVAHRRVPTAARGVRTRQDLRRSTGEAVLLLFMDTGMRRGELLGLTLDDVDLDRGLVRVTGKGSRTRTVGIGANTVRSVDRYLRARANIRP